MEAEILDIVKELLAISIGFVGLVLTAYSILMTLSDENWKIKSLKQTKQYKTFIGDIANLAVGFMGLFIFSILILVGDKIVTDTYRFIFNGALYCYLLILFYLAIKTVGVLNKFKKIILLLSNREKPFFDVQSDSHDQDDE